MSEATLAVRPGETVWGYEEPPTDAAHYQHVYAVALLTAPPMPGERHETCTPFALVACQAYPVQSTGELAWGWVDVTPESKAEIGDMLMRSGFEPDRWYYIVVGVE